MGPLCQKNVYTLIHRTKGVYMYTCTFTEGKAHMGWKIKVFVQGIFSRCMAQGIWSEVFGPRY